MTKTELLNMLMDRIGDIECLPEISPENRAKRDLLWEIRGKVETLEDVAERKPSYGTTWK